MKNHNFTMHFLVAFILFGPLVYSYSEDVIFFSKLGPAYGYMTNIGIPEAEIIRKAEKAGPRIVGGVPATLGQYPFQVNFNI